jgi:hypothetical protein
MDIAAIFGENRDARQDLNLQLKAHSYARQKQADLWFRVAIAEKYCRCRVFRISWCWINFFQ